MPDYTLIASKQLTLMLPTLFGSQWLSVFDSDLAENYVTFGSDHQKFVGKPKWSPWHRHCTVQQNAHFAYVNCYIFANCSQTQHRPQTWVRYIFQKPMKRRFQRRIVRTEILSTFHVRVEYISVTKYAIETTKPMGQTTPKYYSPFLLRHVDPHITHECLGWPHSPPQTTAQLLHALPHNYATKSPLVTMGCHKSEWVSSFLTVHQHYSVP